MLGNCNTFPKNPGELPRFDGGTHSRHLHSEARHKQIFSNAKDLTKLHLSLFQSTVIPLLLGFFHYSKIKLLLFSLFSWLFASFHLHLPQNATSRGREPFDSRPIKGAMGAATGWAKSSSAKPSGRRCAVGPVKGFLPGATLLVVGCWWWLWFPLYHTGSYLVAWLLALWFLCGGMFFFEFQWVLSGGWRMVFLVSPSNWWITPRQCSWSYVWFPAIVILLENIAHHFGIWDAYKPVYDSDSGAVCRCRISCINSAVLLFLLILPVSIPYSQKMPRVVAVQFSIFCTTNCTNYT